MLPHEVHVAPYDPAWPALFEREAARLRAACAGLGLRVEHVGSTSVPGLAAKPVIDVLAVRPRGSDARAYVEAITKLGWTHRGEHGIPGRDYFRLGEPGRTHHLHLFEEGMAQVDEHLAFRDTLRARPALAREYARLKRGLAARYPHDRAAYTEAKAAYVRDVLRVAQLDRPPRPHVRLKAVCVVRRGGEILVDHARDPLTGETFAIPPGGGVEFGETAEDAVRREVLEELGAEIADVALLGVMESVFVYGGRPEHELVFAFEARLVDEALYARDALDGVEAGRGYVARWRPLADFAPGGDRPLYPDGLYALLAR